MIANGEKTIETRTWPCPTILYNGSLLLVGSKSPKGEYSGMAACVVRPTGSHRMRKDEEEAARCEVYPRAISWMLEDVQKVKPFPVKGQLGLYEVDDRLIQLLGTDNDTTGTDEG